MTAARADRDGRHAGLGRDRRPDDVRLCHQRDRLRRRGGDRASPRARGDTRRPAGGERAGLRLQPRGPREGAGQSRRPVRDDLPDDGLLQRAARSARRPSTSAAGSAISATAGRSPNGSAADATGGSRSWTASSLCEEIFGTVKGVAGGNLILMGSEPAGDTRWPPRRPSPPCVAAPMSSCRFPGESRARARRSAASTRRFAPAPTPHTRRRCAALSPPTLPAEAQCSYEIVIDGLTLEAVERATAAGLRAGARPDLGMVAITAGNYGGKLGPFHIRLREVLNRYSEASAQT